MLACFIFVKDTRMGPIVDICLDGLKKWRTERRIKEKTETVGCAYNSSMLIDISKSARIALFVSKIFPFDSLWMFPYYSPKWTSHLTRTCKGVKFGSHKKKNLDAGRKKPATTSCWYPHFQKKKLSVNQSGWGISHGVRPAIHFSIHSIGSEPATSWKIVVLRGSETESHAWHDTYCTYDVTKENKTKV